MPNVFITPTWVVNESAERFQNSVKAVEYFDRSYDDQFKKSGAKVGNTVFARLPWIPTLRSGQAWQPAAILDQTRPVTLTYQSGVDLEWSSIQETTEVDRIRERYIDPSADLLAAFVDARAMNDVYSSVYSMVGTPGTTPSSALTFMQARGKIFDLAGGEKDFVAILDFITEMTMVNAYTGTFNPQTVRSEDWERGVFGKNQLGIGTWQHDQQVVKHTTGTFTSSTPIVDNASQTGSTITSTGWASGATALVKGDCIEFAGVYSVNPLTKTSTGRLAQFVLTANISDTAGAIQLPIYPSLVTSGPLQNVTASPAASAAIYVWGTRSTTYAQAATVSPQNLVFRPQAFALVMADLVDPVAGAKASFARSDDWGINIRFVQQFLLASDQNGSRLDCIHGAAPIQERLACRVAA